MFDRVYKILKLTVALLFLVVLFEYSQNGRYSYQRQSEPPSMQILDTRTGIVYIQSGDHILALDPKKSTLNVTDLKRFEPK